MQKAARERLIAEAGNVAAGRERVVDGRSVWWESEDRKIRVFPSVWNGGWNNADLATFDPRKVYDRMLNPLTGRADVEQRIDPRRFWMRRPQVATLGQRNKAARSTTAGAPGVVAPSASSVAAPAVLPTLALRVALLRADGEQANAAGLTAGAYRVAENLVADWDGTVFANLRAA
jgi:hypothetical protein